MYCALDKIDLAAVVEGRRVAVQTDHRTTEEIERDLALSVLFALTRVINARNECAQVHYIVTDPPARLAEALAAAGAVVSPATTRLIVGESPAASEHQIAELADACFREIAQRTATQVGTRDLAIALRMLEDQTFTSPPSRDDPAAYWRRVIELAALAGELLRAKFGAAAHWVVNDRALIPFGFTLPSTTDSTVVFPTNRAQRVIAARPTDGGREESLFKLLIAAEETLETPPDATGRWMPSLRDRRHVELDELIWRPLLPETPALPIVVCGIDGESTFGMIRRDALQRTPEETWDEALANLAAETIEIGETVSGELGMLVLSGSFYAAEKVLDRELLRDLHADLDAEVLLAATPERGQLILTARETGADAQFAELVRARYAAAGGRGISAAVLVIEDGAITGVVPGTA